MSQPRSHAFHASSRRASSTLASHALTASQSTSGNPVLARERLGNRERRRALDDDLVGRSLDEGGGRSWPGFPAEQRLQERAHASAVGHAASHAAMNAFQCAASDAAMRSRIKPISRCVLARRELAAHEAEALVQEQRVDDVRLAVVAHVGDLARAPRRPRPRCRSCRACRESRTGAPSHPAARSRASWNPASTSMRSMWRVWKRPR